MSATVIASTAAQACGGTLRHLRSHPEGEWYTWIEQAVNTERPVQGLRNWLIVNGHRKVLTLQARVDRMSQEVRGLWAPGPRTVDTAYSYVDFYDSQTSYSRRYFAGIHALKSNGDTWVGYDSSTNTLIVFRAVA